MNEIGRDKKPNKHAMKNVIPDPSRFNAEARNVFLIRILSRYNNRHLACFNISAKYDVTQQHFSSTPKRIQ